MNTVDRGLVCVSVAAVDAAAVIASVRPVLSLADAPSHPHNAQRHSII